MTQLVKLKSWVEKNQKYVFFSEKTFLSQKNSEIKNQILERRGQLSRGRYRQRFELAHQMWAGGAPSPSGSPNSKQARLTRWVAVLTPIRCILRPATIISIPEQTPYLNSEKPAKKQKVPTLPQKSPKPKVVRNEWNSHRRLLKKSATRKK